MTVSEPVPEYRFATESRLAFYRSLLTHYRKQFVGMMGLVWLYSALTALRIPAVGVVLEAVQFKFSQERGKLLTVLDARIHQLLGPNVPSLFDRLVEDRFFLEFLFAMLGFFAIAAVLMAIAFFLKEYLGQSLIVRMEVDVRKALFQHITRQSVAYFNRQRSGDVISRLTNDISALRSSFKLFFEDIVQQPVTIILTLAVAYAYSPLLFWLTVPFYGFLMVPVVRSGKKVIKHGRGRLEKLSIVTEAIQQLFSGIRIVKAFGMERYEEEEFAEKNREFVRSTLKLTRAKMKGRSFQELLYNLGTGIVVLLGVWFISTKWVEVVAFGMFMGCMVQIYNPLKALTSAWSQLQESRAGGERLLEVLREKPLIKDHDGALAFPGVKEEIRFEDVSFSYGELDPALAKTSGEEGALRLPVLNDVSFSARAGEVVALVGPSGAGKSTIVDLLARFYDPQRGSILIDGRDIRDYRFASYLKAVAIVSQDPFLFHTTIRENIRYGKESATDEDIEQAARVAFAHDFIVEQPDGYDTLIGERGVKLSGGQRQRITIARAVLKNAQILILDEATSSLDSQSEKEVQHAIDNLIRSRTTFVIAHRLSTIVHADKILVIVDGRIVETGHHEDLLKARGKYYQLWRSQNPEV